MGVSEDNYEIHFAVKHLDNALIIKHLLPTMLKTQKVELNEREVLARSFDYAMVNCQAQDRLNGGIAGEKFFVLVLL